jgi:hypothetical protein
VKFFGKSSSSDAPDSVLLSGYESEDQFQSRSADWESEADDVNAAVAQALAWIGTSDRQVEVIETRGGGGRVVALVTASGTEWIEG